MILALYWLGRLLAFMFACVVVLFVFILWCIWQVLRALGLTLIEHSIDRRRERLEYEAPSPQRPRNPRMYYSNRR